jgi:predicted HicB family RNase H-like nuclease
MARKAKWTKQLNLVISYEVHRSIKEITDKQEISMAEWIRTALDEKLKRERHVDEHGHVDR